MGSKPPQPRKGQQSFPFQSLPHRAGNGREKSGAVRLQKAEKLVFSLYFPNLRRQRKGHMGSLSNPFPTVPETAGRKAAQVRL